MPFGDEPVLVRVHSECLTGDVFGSYRCDCGPQLAAALAQIEQAGRSRSGKSRKHRPSGILSVRGQGQARLRKVYRL
ncbi:hypothetical protein [Bacillus paralicheniformis]|uniref:hypothetical protein n=1 Tax=Bacillus paralicheniformis TaxID=1648923 RepID=UPI003BFA72D4